MNSLILREACYLLGPGSSLENKEGAVFSSNICSSSTVSSRQHDVVASGIGFGVWAFLPHSLCEFWDLLKLSTSVPSPAAVEIIIALSEMLREVFQIALGT